MATVNQCSRRLRSPCMPPPTTRTNVDTDAVTAPAATASAIAFAAPVSRRARR